MSVLRVFSTSRGPMCGSCVEEVYATKIDATDGPIGYDIDHRLVDVFPTPFADDKDEGFTGGYCVECGWVMPADGTPGGRKVRS